MDSCEVLIVGGGPAGSTCAGRLMKAGIDVLLLDKVNFPRSKPCAGWITPEVLETLDIDRDEYRREQLLQEICSFRIGLINGPEAVIRYGKVVSYGIRRCEFDHYLLKRSAVRHSLGEPVAALERKDGWWLVNGHIKARLLVGAGGHFCPVARLLGAQIGTEAVIAAQVAELAMSREEERLCPIPADTPALFFCRDLKGYGWLFRKGNFLNIGLGRMDKKGLNRHMDEFRAFLREKGYWGGKDGAGFQGHAYLLYERQGGRRRVSDGALLTGDAAGLSFPQSGEGILPAIESALLAADTILAAKGDYRADNLEPYAARLASRFANTGMAIPSSPLSSGFLRLLGAVLLSNSWFARHIVLDRWFLHTGREVLP